MLGIILIIVKLGSFTKGRSELSSMGWDLD